MTEGKKALLVMGCPEVPVQISIVIYLAHKLKKEGWDVTVAGTNAPIKLLKTADPEGYYVQKTADLDWIIQEIVEKKMDFDACFAFMHSDAGMAYGATFSAISRAVHYAVVFGKNAESLGESIDYPTEKIVAKATHNPGPLKSKIDKVII
ncbi:DUF1890 domain-containing protein [Methanothrix soehngenii]|jgi:hypothetical protein|uniref:DUF1890 domain-containing protein n=1 Tax=Methanothrix soehngenii TaxID=2223 RepID=UPI0023F051D7|nr:DUF1890 domain-containing protein [Methanothrix soehngenii]MCK9586160.1 DUF1890 domain-containing protein [Methanothrix soehngenii]MDD5258095.1 DUF1890 domain-containing protein [Methanothrix soehngenii]MDD5736628.1 DUF1890 domain-containing protein [Methanothrix soehngenii]